MRRKLFASLFILLSATLAQGFQGSGKWIKFSPPGGDFSVLMPGAPKETTETHDSQIGKYTAHTFLAIDNSALYLAGWVDYAPGVKLNIEGELAANRDNFAKGLNGKVTSETKITLGEYPGIEFKGESEKLVFRSRVYLVNNRPYMLVVGWLPGATEPPDADAFFASFELLNGAKG